MEHILAILKYDYKTLQLSDDWCLYCETAVNKLVEYGFTGFIPEPHANVEKVDGWEDQLTKNVNRQLQFFDLAHAHGLSIVLQPGNPRSATWGACWEGEIARPLYLHPAVISVKNGDEPKQAEWDNRRIQREVIWGEFPDMKIMTIMIGEIIGGPTTLTGEAGYDHLTEVKGWWAEDPRIEKWVRNYCFRSRWNPDYEGNKGDFDIYNPHVPEKLAVPFPEMCRIMAMQGEWNLVIPGFGKGVNLGEEAYWRYPTKTDLLQMMSIADYNGVDKIAIWPVSENSTPNPPQATLLDGDWNPMPAHDGSYPIDAVLDYK